VYNILAIDDEAFNLDLIEATFSFVDGVKLYFASSAKDGFDILRDNSVDVVLLDISMPEVDGLEALEIMKKEYPDLPIIMVTANHEKQKEALELGASDFLGKPFDIDELRLRTVNYAKLKQAIDIVKNQKKHLEDEVTLRTSELQDSLALAIETEKEIASRLGRVSEYRDMETGGHIKRMAQYSFLLAKLYGLDEDECELILNAAPLHDVGKVAISDSILLKPGKFTEDEFEIMKTHAKLGAEILSGAEKFKTIEAGRIIALEHHEKFDGSGYPNSKKGKGIHLYARIVAIADVFDALNSKRVYKDAIDLDTVIKIIKDGRATHFDPELLDLFLENIDLFLEVQKSYPE